MVTADQSWPPTEPLLRNLSQSRNSVETIFACLNPDGIVQFEYALQVQTITREHYLVITIASH